MNYLKRAVSSLLYYKKNTLILFFIFFLLSSLILSGFSVLVACEKSAENLRKDIGASVTINNYNVTTSDIFYGANLISPESVEEITSHHLVTGYNPYILSMGISSEDIQAHVAEAQIEKYGKENSTWLRVEGTADMRAISYFVTGDYFLAEGRAFEKTDRMRAIISTDVANLSGLSVGDTFTLNAFYSAEMYGGENVELEIVGIFAIKNYVARTDAGFYNSENVIYVTPDAAYILNGNDNIYNLKCEISDPLEAANFVEDIKNMDLPESEEFRFIIDDTQYRSMESSINSMTNIAMAMLIAAIIMGVIVLTLLIMISLKDRDFELGILLSMGEVKWRIVTQFVLECLCPVLLAMTATVFVSGFISRIIERFFGDSIEVFVNTQPILLMYLCGVALTLIASSVTVYKVVFYQPKKILMAME